MKLIYLDSVPRKVILYLVSPYSSLFKMRNTNQHHIVPEFYGKGLNSMTRGRSKIGNFLVVFVPPVYLSFSQWLIEK